MIIWIFPATQAHLSYWRGDTLLLPAALLLPRAPAWLAFLLTAAALVLMPFVALPFLQNRRV